MTRPVRKPLIFTCTDFLDIAKHNHDQSVTLILCLNHTSPLPPIKNLAYQILIIRARVACLTPSHHGQDARLSLATKHTHSLTHSHLGDHLECPNHSPTGFWKVGGNQKPQRKPTVWRQAENMRLPLRKTPTVTVASRSPFITEICNWEARDAKRFIGNWKDDLKISIIYFFTFAWEP